MIGHASSEDTVKLLKGGPGACSPPKKIEILDPQIAGNAKIVNPTITMLGTGHYLWNVLGWENSLQTFKKIHGPFC